MKKLIYFLAPLFLILGIVYWFSLKDHYSYPVELFPFWLGNTELKVEIADSPGERGQGLSGRTALPNDRGMLFIFDELGLYPFWMRDMKFPLDIIWLDSDYNVVDMVRNAEPSSYPDSFTPEKPARYVLETNAGWVDKNNIKIGTTAKLGFR